MIRLSMGFFIPEVKNRAMSSLLNACFAILDIATNFWLIQTCGVIYKRNTAFSEQVLATFQATARIFVQTVKFPPVISRNNSTSK